VLKKIGQQLSPRKALLFLAPNVSNNELLYSRISYGLNLYIASYSKAMTEKLLLIFSLLLVAQFSYSQNPGCEVRGQVKTDTSSACYTYYSGYVHKIYIPELDNIIKPEWNDEFNTGWIPSGEYELCVVHYNCYSFKEFYMDTVQIPFTCKSDSIIQIEVIINSECPFDSKILVCPKCKKEDQVVLIVYNRRSKRLRKKEFRRKILIGGENTAECKPVRWCWRDNISF